MITTIQETIKLLLAIPHFKKPVTIGACLQNCARLPTLPPCDLVSLQLQPILLNSSENVQSPII